MDKQSLLIEEYKGCDEKVSRLDSLIWQTASVIFPISLAGFGYYGISTNHTPDQFVVLLVVGIGSTTLLLTWYLLARAWYGYQALAFYRMREIETELDLWHYRYAKHMRQSKEERSRILSREKNKSLKERFERLDEQMEEIPKIGLKATIRVLTSLFVLGWLALLVREAVLTF